MSLLSVCFHVLPPRTRSHPCKYETRHPRGARHPSESSNTPPCVNRPSYMQPLIHPRPLTASSSMVPVPALLRNLSLLRADTGPRQQVMRFYVRPGALYNAGQISWHCTTLFRDHTVHERSTNTNDLPMDVHVRMRHGHVVGNNHCYIWRAEIPTDGYLA